MSSLKHLILLFRSLKKGEKPSSWDHLVTYQKLLHKHCNYFQNPKSLNARNTILFCKIKKIKDNNWNKNINKVLVSNNHDNGVELHTYHNYS